jgi:hypothetical protein
MSLALAPRRRRAATVAVAVLLVPVGLVTLQQSQAQAAAVSTITSIAPAKVAAGVANKVITITGTGFDEDQITSVSLNVGGDSACRLLTAYVVASTTSLVVKTPTGGCTATDTTALPTGETVTVTEVGGAVVTTPVTTAAQRLTFVPPPEIATTNPVITENSSNLATGDEVVTLLPAGGQLIRVRALGTFGFDGRTSATNTLSGTLGTKALTTILVYNSEGVLQGTTAPSVGNYFTARTPLVLAAGGSHILSITQNGVSKSFTTTATGLSWPATPTINTISVTSGKASFATAVTITGTNFDSVLADYSGTVKAWVKFCDVSATVSAATVVVATGVTTLTLTTPDTTDGAAFGFASGVFEGVCPVRVASNVDSTALISPITATTFFAFLAN